MKLNEAKQILKQSGYICEANPRANAGYRKRTIAAYGLDKTNLILLYKFYDDEGEVRYEEIYGPCALEQMENFIKEEYDLDIFEISINPTPEQEPEEGLILRTSIKNEPTPLKDLKLVRDAEGVERYA